ncbi:MAG: signal peptidase I [Gammaproteobacteria bacterium]
MNGFFHFLQYELGLTFASALTLLTLLTGVVWALDKWVLGPRRRGLMLDPQADKPGWFVDFCRSFFPVILIVLLLRSFVAEPFRIPSGSMMPTLRDGDFILVNKYTYGLRDPVFHRKFLAAGQPARGDVVVFRFPKDTRKDFIKRVIGLPGDRIAYRDKRLIVNGESVPITADGVYTETGPRAGVVLRFAEELGPVNHRILQDPGRRAEDVEFQVPEGHYFMMGDNRDGSDDSRSWGFVPEGNLVGRAFFIWMSWDFGRSRPDFSRIGNRIE